ncbi:MAG: alpha/beta fold hydrolase, partial [Caulobacteraceae bacterium]
MPKLAIGDRFEMSYREQGSGRPLLFVHGWAAHGGFFQPQIDTLSKQYRVICPDLRGHGASTDASGEPLTVPLLGADLAAFIEALDLADIVAVGWSLGAMVLWETSLLGAGSRISALVVEDMSPRIVNDADWSLGLKGGYDASGVASAVQAMERDWPSTARFVARAMFAEPDTNPELLAWAETELAAQNPRAMAQLWACLAEQDYRRELARIDIPALVIHGEFGLYDAETARYLERQLLNARRVAFQGAGHAPHLEAPDRFNQLVSD